MLKVKAGDLDRLGLLYERHKHALFGFFFRLTANRDTSEDLVQTVFYRMLKYRKSYTGEGKFISWMYQLARNVRADHYKKHRHLTYAEDLGPWEGALGEGGAADEALGQAQELALLQQAMARLTPEQRELLVLTRYQGLRHQEVAEIYGAKEGAIKVRVHRALKALREHFMTLENGTYP